MKYYQDITDSAGNPLPAEDVSYASAVNLIKESKKLVTLCRDMRWS